MRAGPDARTLAGMLAGRTPALAAELLPHGRREGPEWRCGGLDGGKGQSLAVRLNGARAGVWSDFATGERGDALDLVAAVLFGGDRGQAMRWARRWLGLGDDMPPPQPMRRAPAAHAPSVDIETVARRRKALALFLEGQEGIAGTPAGAYLETRGIALADLGRQPRALRFHPACWCAEASRPMPAMLAAITDGAGQHIATHRTFIAPDAAGAWRKAPLTQPKKVLGSFAGGFIPLQRGASAVPLAAAPEGEAVVLAEGVETALSVALGCPDLRVLAAVSLGNLARVDLPPAVRTVIIAADNDPPGSPAAAALQRAVDAFDAQGRAVRIARSPTGKDFNDCLTAEAGA